MSDGPASPHADFVHTARTLSEALPYMRRFAGQTIVV